MGDDWVVGFVAGLVTVTVLLMVTKRKQIFGRMYAVFLTRGGLFTTK